MRCLITITNLVDKKIQLRAASIGSIETSTFIVYFQITLYDKMSCLLEMFLAMFLKRSCVHVICYLKRNVCGNLIVMLAKLYSHFFIVEMSTSSSSCSNILFSVYTELYAHPRKASISQAGL